MKLVLLFIITATMLSFTSTAQDNKQIVRLAKLGIDPANLEQ